MSGDVEKGDLGQGFETVRADHSVLTAEMLASGSLTRGYWLSIKIKMMGLGWARLEW
jgi:hypothetical protein